MGRHWHSTKLLVVDQSERRQVTACHQEEQAWDHQHGDSALTPPGSSVWGLLIMNNENDRDSEMFWKTEDQGLSLVVRDIRVGDKPSAQHWMFNDNEGKRIVNWWPSTGTLARLKRETTCSPRGSIRMGPRCQIRDGPSTRTATRGSPNHAMATLKNPPESLKTTAKNQKFLFERR